MGLNDFIGKYSTMLLFHNLVVVRNYCMPHPGRALLGLLTLDLTITARHWAVSTQRPQCGQSLWLRHLAPWLTLVGGSLARG